MSCQLTMEDHRGLISLKASVVDAIRMHMAKTGAAESFYNKITGGTGACENVPTAFILQNAPALAFLSQTDQLLMEAEILEYGLDAVWTLGRSYRNESRAGDGRHLAEFALLEYEARDMDLPKLLNFQQTLLNTVMEVGIQSSIVPAEHKERLKRYLDTPAVVITYTDILKRLNDGGVSIKWGDDFRSDIEEMVCLLFNGPVQVTHYPESIKFFNMYRTDRGRLEEGLPIEVYNRRRYTVDCVDFLLPWAGETFGASRREENYHTLKVKLRESQMFKQMVQLRADKINNGEVTDEVMEAAWQPFVQYLELFNPEENPARRSVQRSGFGLGMGRLIQFLLGSTQVVPF
ncbi:MAG: amino acid--tRNA ligase-related protein [Phycisphaerae bacterium]